MAEDRKSRAKILGPRGEVVYDQILAELRFLINSLESLG